MSIFLTLYYLMAGLFIAGWVVTEYGSSLISPRIKRLSGVRRRDGIVLAVIFLVVYGVDRLNLLYLFVLRAGLESYSGLVAFLLGLPIFIYWVRLYLREVRGSEEPVVDPRVPVINAKAMGEKSRFSFFMNVALTGLVSGTVALGFFLITLELHGNQLGFLGSLFIIGAIPGSLAAVPFASRRTSGFILKGVLSGILAGVIITTYLFLLMFSWAD